MVVFRLPVAAALAVLALGACQTGTTAEPAIPAADPLVATLSADACPDVGDRAYFFWMEPRSAQPGDKIALFPYWTDMPGAYNDLPPGCLGDLGVYPEGAATFTRQEGGLAIAAIGAEVEPGTTVLLSGTYRGAHGLSGPVQVYRAADNPLVGTWHQAEEGCPAESAVRELVFTAGGQFSVTWTPFEAYKDYWGTYTYDPETGTVRLEVEGGNQVPADMVGEGVAIPDGDRLTFSTLSFGTPQAAGGGCGAGFSK